MQWDERDYDWFEIWHQWDRCTALAVVCKFRGQDEIELRELPFGKLWLKSKDYAEIQNELMEDEYSQVKGRELSDELYDASLKE